jgi:uncharacterized Zn finger protein (UPF0148 family)
MGSLTLGFMSNRHFALCSRCGHPLLAHLGGPCHCGCRGRATYPSSSARIADAPKATRAQTKKRRRPRSSPTVPKSIPRNTALDDFMAFVQYHLSHNELDQLTRRIANAEGVAVAPTAEYPAPRLRKLLREHCSDEDISKYLDALKARKATGSPYIREA